MIRFAVKRNNKYLIGIKANEDYKLGVAPTMGVRHSLTEYSTLWGNEPKYFDYRTIQSYFNVLVTEYFWEAKTPNDFKIITANR